MASYIINVDTEEIMENIKSDKFAILVRVALVLLFFTCLAFTFRSHESAPNTDKLRQIQRRDLVNVKNITEPIPKPNCTDNKNITDEKTGKSRMIRIAIGGAATTAKLNINSTDMTKILPIFTCLVPSFCKTASPGYEYAFFFAYDFSDPLYQYPEKIDLFYKRFREMVDHRCSPDIIVDFHLAWTPFEKVPGYAHEAGMMEAYLENFDYYYRINDDTTFRSPGWAEAYIETLASFYPTNLGVVGPTHLGDYNPTVLTYDFTHKTHMDIFGIYYPRIYKDWWLDNWVTRIYEPNQSIQHPDIKIVHTRQFGMRYKVSEGVGDTVDERIRRDKAVIQRYIKYKTTKQPPTDPKKVIAFSLFGKDVNYTYGAIRNAQIAPVFFPGWTVRFYIPDETTAPGAWVVPKRIIQKLLDLGATIKTMHVSYLGIDPRLMSNLIVDDEAVELFQVRNADEHLSDRQFSAVKKWMESGKAFHCIRDHPRHTKLGMSLSLYGGKRERIRRYLGMPMLRYLQLFSQEDYKTLQEEHHIPQNNMVSALWELMKYDAVCHDSVSCMSRRNAKPLPWIKDMDTFEGMKMDGYMQHAEEMIQYDPENPCAKYDQFFH